LLGYPVCAQQNSEIVSLAQPTLESEKHSVAVGPVYVAVLVLVANELQVQTEPTVLP
jgi:hypothetical protein